MSRTIAFLRAINVGGRFVKMEVLRELFRAAGLQNVATFINSGNVIFDTPQEDAEALAARLEKALAQGLGFEVPVMLREAELLAMVVDASPFAPGELGEDETLYVSFLREEPESGAAVKLATARNEVDDLRLHGREVYWLYRRGQGESTLTNGKLEKLLGVTATRRNMNTVRKLAEKYGAG